MSVAILKNIYSYLEVLQTASSDNVSQWDQKALQHALKWAEYCERVYSQAQGKPYRKELDNAIQKFETHPVTISQERVNLEFLKDAKEHLRKALLQNSVLTMELFESVLHSYGNIAENPAQFIQDCYALAKPKASVQLLSALLTSVSSTENDPSSKKSTIIPPDICIIAQGHMLLEFAIKTMQLQGGTERHGNILAEKLHSIAGKEVGLQIVVTALTCDLEEQKLCHNAQQVKPLILDWLLYKYDKQEMIWKLPASLLSKTSEHHMLFYKSYIQYLSKQADNLAETTLPSPRTILDGEHYQLLVGHFRSLLNTEGRVCEATTMVVKNNADIGRHYLWSDLERELEI